MTRPLRLACVLLASCCSALPVLAQAFDPKSPVPAPGVHPRIFFTPAEVPALKARLSAPGVFGTAVRQRFEGARRDVPAYRAFAALDLSDRAVLLKALEDHFKPDEQRNIKWGLLALDAIARDDVDQKRLIAGVITNYARLILASKELGAGPKVTQGTGSNLSRQAGVWANDDFGVGQSWLLGAAGLPVAYDLLHADMTPDQREVVRKALVAATAGRKPHGAGEPRGRAISNHYGYHGELAVMLAAVEGTDGFDRQAWVDIRQILLDYWDVGFTPEGACHEDSYGPNLGLRAGSLGLLALARRGDDVFSTDKYRRFVEWNVHEVEPFAGGTLVGGASGIGLDYNTSLIVAHYARPELPAARFLYAHDLGPDLKHVAGQCALHFALFGTDPAPPTATAADVGLPLTAFAPRRGKLITRSDWSPDATVLHFDARPDAFTIGHDTVDRGNFTLLALGRAWTKINWFRNTTNSTDFSLVHIDGLAQPWKAPSVKWLARADAPLATLAAADLKYAYDWQWSPPTPWPTEKTTFPAPWEPERSDPRALGWPVEQGQDPDWLPKSLYGEPGIGYQGSWLWRRPYNPVRHAFRTTALVRGERPYTLLLDDIRKDDTPRTYTWLMQVQPDLVAEASGKDLILRDPTSDRRLLVRVLSADGFVSVRAERYTIPDSRKNQPPVQCQRVVVEAKSADPKFRVLLYPLAPGTPLPDTSATDTVLSVGNDRIEVTPTASGRSAVKITRGEESVELN